MRKITLWLGLAAAGALLQLVALGLGFYVHDDSVRGAWSGIPHATHLILAAALVTIALAWLIAAERSPVRGDHAGLAIAGLGLLASLQVGYRMLVPPFEGCYRYNCLPAEATSVGLLPGIWLALVGSLAVIAGGLVHSFTATARQTPPRFWVASRQTGFTSWLGLAALGALGQFVLGYTVFTFYATPGSSMQKTWSGWIPTPHTSSLVLASTVIVLGLVWAAARRRSPLRPGVLGVVVAIAGLISGFQIFYRIVDVPFRSRPVEIGWAAYLAVAAAVLLIIAGVGQAAAHWRDQESP